MERRYRAVKAAVKPGVSSGPVIRAVGGALLLAFSLAGVPRAGAQGVPAFAPINPVAASRSGVYFQPFRDAGPGRWTGSLSLDYASVIELNDLPPVSYTLDSEILRLRLGVGRDLGPRTFLLADAEVGGAYAGFLDGIIDWYHRTLGFHLRERERRPRNDFRYELLLPSGQSVFRSPSDLFLGDVRLGAGFRFGGALQSVVSVTLPTSTAPVGYGRGVVSVSVLNTLRVRPHPRLVIESGLGIGYTPSHGDLGDVQRETFASVNTGARYRFWGRQSLFANVFYHSPYYHGTLLPALDRHELSLDFGWILSTRSGADWRLGLTEDLEPGGPAIDLVFRLGRSF